MSKEKKPLLSDEFLEELANEINEQYGKSNDNQDNPKNKNESQNE
jgi:hypothetical protein